MRILLATPLLPPDIGGPATYSHLLLERLPTQGFFIDPVHFGKVRYLPPGIRHVTYFTMLLLRTRKANLVLALDPFSVGLPAMVAARLFGKKFVLKVVGDFAWEQGTQRFGVSMHLDEFIKKPKEQPFMVRLYIAIERYVAKRADLVMVPSEYLRKVVIAWGVAKEHTTVIYNGTPDLSEQGNRETLRGILGFKGKLIVSVGRLVPWKGFGALIDVMPRIIKKFSDVKLMIIGSGPLEKELERRVEELGLSEHVVLSGKLPRVIMHRYLRASDVFVLNSAYEGFSHALLEVLSVGVPVVSSDAGGNPELIKNESSGILVRFNDKKAIEHALVRILSDKALGARYVGEGRRVAGRFSEDRTAIETGKVLRRICASS